MSRQSLWSLSSTLKEPDNGHALFKFAALQRCFEYGTFGLMLLAVYVRLSTHFSVVINWYVPE